MAQKKKEKKLTQKEQEEKTAVVVQPIQSQVVKFGQYEPEKLVERATKMANALAPIIDKQKLYIQIGNKKYVMAEGWTTMLAMLGVFPEVEWTKKIERGEEIVYEARVILKTMNGDIVSAAESMCSSKEKNWQGRDEFAIRSMAQTRATGKAARLPFAWIMALGGYAGTPAEEMNTDTTKPPFKGNEFSSKKKWSKKSKPVTAKSATAMISKEQIEIIHELAKEGGAKSWADVVMLSAGILEKLVTDMKELTYEDAVIVIKRLTAEEKQNKKPRTKKGKIEKLIDDGEIGDDEIPK
ncbi:hypothetical protein MYX07_00230 [Patescibacteria group bacterium AH-259-L07]|nr:hypothetical protein [Patescibacteria group bacterium AH-259-L07]